MAKLVRSRRSINFKPGIGLSQSVMIGLGSPRAMYHLFPISPLGKIVAFSSDFMITIAGSAITFKSLPEEQLARLIVGYYMYWLNSPPRVPTTRRVRDATDEGKAATPEDT